MQKKKNSLGFCERRLCRTLLFFFSLHLALLGFVSWARSEGPSQKLFVTSSSTAVVLSGETSLGFKSFRLFENWQDFEGYMKKEELQLPHLAAAFRQRTQNAKIAKLDSAAQKATSRISNSEAHKIIWEDLKASRKVIYTPDLYTAQVFQDYLTYRGLDASYLGFSLPILKQN